jgi:hypothetical protein
MKTFKLQTLLKRQKVMKSIILMVVLILSFSYKSFSLVEKLSFDKLVNQADLIFIGTAKSENCFMNANQTLILTEVLFEDLEIIYASEKSLTRNTDFVKLTYAGGVYNGLSLQVSDMPFFYLGERYLLFIKDDGEIYANPVIGAAQGQFLMIADESEGTEYVLTASGKAIWGVEDSELICSKNYTEGIEDGIINFTAETSQQTEKYCVNPVSSDGLTEEQSYTTSTESKYNLPLTKKEFIELIITIKENNSKNESTGEDDNGGWFYFMDGNNMKSMKILEEPDGKFVNLILPIFSNDLTLNNHNTSLNPKGGQIGYCGYQDLFIVMQQVPTTWWDYDVYNRGMYDWNQVMDVYRYTAWDGSYGPNNGQSEFYSFWSDYTIFQYFGIHWGDSYAKCLTWSAGGCGEIYESDIVFNQGISWTDDINISLNNPSIILLAPVLMHELGHSWGAQRGSSYPETYDYDDPTVMHAYYSNIYETGRGIHRGDAYMIRRNYKNQTSIMATKDIGVESYYASNGLHPSTTNKSSYKKGDDLTVYNLTVENLSYSSVSDLRVRFYLSADRNITTSDYQLSGYYYWESFPSESYYTGNFTRQIPSNIPNGTYYVGVIVSKNGFSNDDFAYNNATCLTYPITVLVTNTSETELNQQYSIYPNPVDDIFTIECVFDHPNSGFVITVYDLTGKVILTTPMSRNLVQIDMSQITPGMYFVRLGDENIFSTKKIIKK